MRMPVAYQGFIPIDDMNAFGPAQAFPERRVDGVVDPRRSGDSVDLLLKCDIHQTIRGTCLLTCGQALTIFRPEGDLPVDFR
jgi:hypothetical protein